MVKLQTGSSKLVLDGLKNRAEASRKDEEAVVWGTLKAHELGDLANVSDATPTNGQVLEWNGTEWAPADDDLHPVDGVTIDLNSSSELEVRDGGISTDKLADDAVTNAKIGSNAVDATALNVTGNGTANQLLSSDGDGSFSWVDLNGHGGTEHVFGGADGTNAGTSGLVPAPAATENTEFLRGDGTWATLTPTVAMNDLTDVAAGSPANNDVLTYDTSGGDNEWKNGKLKLASIELPAGLEHRDVIGYNVGSSEWEAITLSLDHLDDVNISSATTGQVLEYNGTEWVNGTVGNTITNLHEIGDVATYTSPDDMFLQYNSTTSMWETTALTGGTAIDIGSDGKTIDHADVNSETSTGSDNTLVNGEAYNVITGVTVNDQGHVTDVETTQFTHTDTQPNDGTLTVSGGTLISGTGTFTADQSTNSTITLDHDATTRTDDTTPTATLAHDGTFTAITALTSSTEGHVTGATTTTYTLPSGAVPNNNTITLSNGVAGDTHPAFTLDQNVDETINFIGGTNIEAVSTATGITFNWSGELNDLSNVSNADPGNHYVLTYNASTSTWEPQSPVDNSLVVFKGTWDSSSTYENGDIVQYNTGTDADPVNHLYLWAGTSDADSTNVPGTDTDWVELSFDANDTAITLAADSGTSPQFTLNQTSAETITFAGGTDITSVASGNTITLNHDSITSNTSTATDAPNHGGTFDAISGITVSSQGHVTNVETTTYTLPAAGGEGSNPLPAAPAHDTTAKQYELNVPADSGDATWVEATEPGNGTISFRTGSGDTNFPQISMNQSTDENIDFTGGTGITTSSLAQAIAISISDDGVGYTQLNPAAFGAGLHDTGSHIAVQLASNSGLQFASGDNALEVVNPVPAIPGAGSDDTRYELQVASDGTHSWVTAAHSGNQGDIVDGAGLEFTGDTLAVDLASDSGLKFDASGDSGQLEVDYTTHEVSGKTYISDILGYQIRGFDDTNGIEVATYVYNNISYSYNPRRILRWDEPIPTGNYATLTINNNADFQSEYITSMVTSIGSDTVDTTNFTAYAASVTANITKAELNAGTFTYDMDPTTGAWDGSASSTYTLSTLMTTNNGKTDTQTSSYGWGSATVGTLTPNFTSQSFDAVRTGYQITIPYSTAASASNIQVDNSDISITSAGGTGVFSTPSTSNVIVTVSGATIYHDTNYAGNAAIDFVKPSTVSAESLANRTYSETPTWSLTPTTTYKEWVILASDQGAFSVADDLGALSNDGYATAATSSGQSAGAWQAVGTTYNFDNSGDTTNARSGYLVVPSVLNSARGFRSTGFGTPQLTPTVTTVALGHSGHTHNYTVYTFTVAAGVNLTAEIYTL